MKRIITIILVLIVLGFAALTFLPNYLSQTSNKQEVELSVDSGDNLQIVAEKLYKQDVIKSKYWFRYKGSSIAANIKPGTYTIPANTRIDKIYDLIQEGEIKDFDTITFPEGFLLYQFAERLEENGLVAKKDFIDATNKYYKENSYEFDTSNSYFKMEGYLFPDTYNFDKDFTVGDIVEALVENMENVFSDEDLQYMEEVELSKHKVLTIASLIEREAYNDEERQTISGVIYNRLDIDMPLQIDATVIYGKGEGKKHITRVLYEDLEIDNPYNTYKNKGLPPGPISSPGKKSIKAALYPEDHNYLYYVLGEDGHVFSETYDKHQENVRKYREIQKNKDSEKEG